jgi:hypothetical protein
MPTYTMKTIDGKTVEIVRPMAKAPIIGKWITLNGVPMQRQADCTIGRATTDRSFASRALPRNYVHHKGKFTENGMPIFDSKRRVDETIARSQGEEPEHPYVYD